jgi:hypothetical protein
MEMSWQTETDRLVCRWSEAGKRVLYNPRWIRDVPRDLQRKIVSRPDLVSTRLSPFGGGEWYAWDRPR